MKPLSNLRKNDPLRRVFGSARWKRHEHLFSIVLSTFPQSERPAITESYLKCLRSCIAMMNFHSSNRDDIRSAQKRLETILRTLRDFEEGTQIGKKLPTSWFSSAINGVAAGEHLTNAAASILLAAKFLEDQSKRLKRGRPTGNERMLRAIEVLEQFGNSKLRALTIDDDEFWSVLGADVNNFDESLDAKSLARKSLLAHAVSALTGQQINFKRLEALLVARAWKNLEPLF